MAVTLADTQGDDFFDNDSDTRRACAVCKAFQPGDGKLLACLHVICVSCLRDCLNRDGSVLCMMCDSTTTGRVPGVDVVTQLVDCQPLLYSVKPGGTRDADVVLCAACCDDDLDSEAQYQCGDCGDRPLCFQHSEKHRLRKSTSGQCHCIRPLVDCVARAREELCRYHPRNVVKVFCQTCSCCVCAKCLDSCAHDDHSVESMASAAAKQRDAFQHYIQRFSTLCAAEKCADPAEGRDTVNLEPIVSLAGVRRHMTSVREQGEKTSELIATLYDQLAVELKKERQDYQECVQRRFDFEISKLHEKRRSLSDLVLKMTESATAKRDKWGITVPYSEYTSWSATLAPLPRASEIRQLSSRPPRTMMDPTGLDDVISMSTVPVDASGTAHCPDVTQCVLRLNQTVQQADETYCTLELRDACFRPARIPADTAMRCITVCRTTSAGVDRKIKLSHQATSRYASIHTILVAIHGSHALDNSELNVRLHRRPLRVYYRWEPTLRFNRRISPRGISFLCDGTIALSSNSRWQAAGRTAHGVCPVERGTYSPGWLTANCKMVSGSHTWFVRVHDKHIKKHYAEACNGGLSRPIFNVGLWDGEALGWNMTFVVKSRPDATDESPRYPASRKETSLVAEGGWGLFSVDTHSHAFKHEARPVYERQQSAALATDVEHSDHLPILWANGDVLVFTLDLSSRILSCANDSERELFIERDGMFGRCMWSRPNKIKINVGHCANTSAYVRLLFPGQTVEIWSGDYYEQLAEKAN